MEITLTTPALLFPAVSLLLLAYTNRFLSLASLVRKLYADYQLQPQKNLLAQLQNLQLRIYLIRAMQGLGVLSLLLCVISMFFIYLGHTPWAAVLFGLSLVTMMLSLFFSLWEIHISTVALSILLQNLKAQQEP